MKPCVLTITMNTYQVINEDETIPPILASDSHRGGYSNCHIRK